MEMARLETQEFSQELCNSSWFSINY
uniref:Uncharacterized protein n=1 Tax=Arundo donax TaxID=35708 RepID=A0A0A9HFM6_ARUDO